LKKPKAEEAGTIKKDFVVEIPAENLPTSPGSAEEVIQIPIPQL